MATKVILERDGIVKDSYVGFSWTVFFFSFLPPLFRGDILGALVILVLEILFALVSAGILNTIFHIILSFAYNKYYTRNLIEKQGFRPLTEADDMLLRAYGIYL